VSSQPSGLAETHIKTTMARLRAKFLPVIAKKSTSFSLTDIITPNKNVSSTVFGIVALCWVALMVTVWATGPASFIPTPAATLAKFPELWFDQGLGEQLWTSFILNVQSVSIMAGLSLMLAYATVLPLFRPLATLVSSGRFNGFVGLPLIFTALLSGPHQVMVALLVYGMTVFTVLSLTKMIDAIPKELYDHSRTLRMGEWRVVWEVVILGRFDEVLDIMRINVAMGWMMLPMVEGRFKFEGGVGALMEINAKQFDYPAVFCTLFVILFVGLLQDYIIGYFKGMVCPYADLGMER